MMKTGVCQQVERLFDQYIDSEIGLNDYRLLRDHIKECEACREDWLTLERTVRHLGSLEPLRVSDAFMPGLLARLPAKPCASRKWYRWVGELAAAAVIITVIGLGTVSNGHTAMVTVSSPGGTRTVKAREVTVLPENTVIQGDLTVLNGDVLLAGKVMGNVTAVEGEVIPTQKTEVQPAGWVDRIEARLAGIAGSFLRGIHVLLGTRDKAGAGD